LFHRSLFKKIEKYFGIFEGCGTIENVVNLFRFCWQQFYQWNAGKAKPIFN